MLCWNRSNRRLFESFVNRSLGGRIVRRSFGESASPFIDEGDGFTRESVGERVCVCCLVLLPTPSGTRRFVGAHNTVDLQMHVVGSIVFFWYGRCRRLPYCRINVGALNIVHVLTCLEGCGASFWHGLIVLFYRCAGYGPYYCG